MQVVEWLQFAVDPGSHFLPFPAQDAAQQRLFGSGFVHEPSHTKKPVAQPGAPLMHCCPEGTCAPHVPQLAGSLVRSTHAPAQSVLGGVQVGVPPMQVPFVANFPHPPQFFGSEEKSWQPSEQRPHGMVVSGAVYTGPIGTL